MQDPKDPINHRYELMCKSGLDKVSKSKNISKRNKEIIISFIEKVVADGIKAKRTAKLIGMVRNLAEWLKKDFDKATKADITRLVATLEKSTYADWTKWSYKRVLKKLYKFLGKMELVDDIKVAFMKEERIQPDQILEPSDIKKLIEAATHPRDRAIIALMGEIGMRTEELRRMKVSHVKLGDNPTVMVPGCKDSPKIRELPVGDSVPYLVSWLGMYPKDSSPDNWLFISLSTNSYGKMLSHYKIFTVLANCGKKARITHPVFPHALRHAAATRLAQYFTESQLNQWFGWRPGSRTSGQYVHAGKNHIENAFYKMRGVCLKCKKVNSLPGSDYCDKCISETQETPRAFLPPRICPRCKQSNTATADACQCGYILDPAKRLEYTKAEEELIQIAKGLKIALAQDPELRLALLARAQKGD